MKDRAPESASRINTHDATSAFDAQTGRQALVTTLDRRVLTGRHLIAAAAIIFGAALLSFRGVYEPDLWWHLAQGRENIAGRLVRSNVFSFTYPDYRQHYTSWLFDTTAYVAWRAGEGAGIQALQTVLLAATLFLTYLACRVRASASAAAAVLLLGFFVIEPRAIPRPHLVSFAGMAACSFAIQRSVEQTRAAPLLAMLPIAIVWSNFHVEVVFGVLLLAIFAIGELIRPAALRRGDALRALSIAAGCLCAMLATPYGVGIFKYLYENAALPQLLSIAEVQPPYLPNYRAFFVYLVVMCAILLSQPRKLALWEAAGAIAFAAIGLLHLRLTPLVFLATAPMVAARVVALTERGIDPRAIVFCVLALGLVSSRVPLTIMATGLRVGDTAIAPAAFFSSNAIAFGRDKGLAGPVFNSNNLGGYLAWTLSPETRIFQDSRLQAYPPEHLRAILNAARSQEAWDTLVAGVDWAVLSVARPNELSGSGRFPVRDWATVFEDDAMEIVVRRSGRFGHLATGQ